MRPTPTPSASPTPSPTANPTRVPTARPTAVCVDEDPFCTLWGPHGPSGDYCAGPVAGVDHTEYMTHRCRATCGLCGGGGGVLGGGATIPTPPTGTTVPSQPTMSRSTCSQLKAAHSGWPIRRPDSAVCGESDNGLEGGCGGRSSTHAEAESRCTEAGARLCTVHELRVVDATRGTGCQFDRHAVWTSDTCTTDTGDAGFRVTRGRSGSALGMDGCHAPSAGVAAGRCCADQPPTAEIAPQAARFVSDSYGYDANEAATPDPAATTADADDEVGTESSSGATSEGIEASGTGAAPAVGGDEGAVTVSGASSSSADSGPTGAAATGGDLSAGALVGLVLVVVLAVVGALALVGALYVQRQRRRGEGGTPTPSGDIEKGASDFKPRPLSVAVPRHPRPSQASLDADPLGSRTSSFQEPTFRLAANGDSVNIKSVRRDNPAYTKSLYVDAPPGPRSAVTSEM